VTVVQHAQCDWCHQHVVVSSRSEADTWLRTHDCPEAVRTPDSDHRIVLIAHLVQRHGMSRIMCSGTLDATLHSKHNHLHESECSHVHGA
jgi:hypothetical protein